MTPAQAKTKEHWHVRDADGVLSSDPYGTRLAARGAMREYEELSPHGKFSVQKIGLRGACPCRESSMPRKSPTHRVMASGDCAYSADAGKVSLPSVLAAPVSSDRKVQTPSSACSGKSVGGGQRVDDQPCGGAKFVSHGASDKAKAPTDLLSQGKEGATTNKPKPGHQHHAGAATSVVPSLEPGADQAAAPATTYGHAETQYLNAISEGGYEG